MSYIHVYVSSGDYILYCKSWFRDYNLKGENKAEEKGISEFRTPIKLDINHDRSQTP